MKRLFILSIILMAAAAGCGFISEDVTATSFMLPEKEFRIDTADLGVDQIGGDTIPSIECPANECPSGDAFYCDEDENLCAAKGTYALTATLHLADEVPELASIGDSRLVDVKFDYIQMNVTENTLNFDLPDLDIYAGPQTIPNLLDDNGNIVSGVHKVGVLRSIPAGITGTFDIQLSEEGRKVMSDYVSIPSKPFNVYVLGRVQFHAGDNVPQGAIVLTIHSMVTAQFSSM